MVSVLERRKACKYWGEERNTQIVTAHRAPDVCSLEPPLQLPAAICLHIWKTRSWEHQRRLDAFPTAMHWASTYLVHRQEKKEPWDEWWQPQLSFPFPFCTLNPNHGRRCKFKMGKLKNSEKEPVHSDRNNMVLRQTVISSLPFAWEVEPIKSEES